MPKYVLISTNQLNQYLQENQLEIDHLNIEVTIRDFQLNEAEKMIAELMILNDELTRRNAVYEDKYAKEVSNKHEELKDKIIDCIRALDSLYTGKSKDDVLIVLNKKDNDQLIVELLTLNNVKIQSTQNYDIDSFDGRKIYRTEGQSKVVLIDSKRMEPRTRTFDLESKVIATKFII
jgi:hypothetical protein